MQNICALLPTSASNIQKESVGSVFRLSTCVADYLRANKTATTSKIFFTVSDPNAEKFAIAYSSIKSKLSTYTSCTLTSVEWGVDGMSDSVNRKKVLLTLDEMTRYPNNWDSNGSTSFSSEHVEFVKNIVHLLSVVPEVFPTGRRSIQLEFTIGTKYLEFEVFENKSISILEEDDSANVYKEYVTKDLNILTKVVSDFYGT